MAARAYLEPAVPLRVFVDVRLEANIIGTPHKCVAGQLAVWAWSGSDTSSVLNQFVLMHKCQHALHYMHCLLLSRVIVTKGDLQVFKWLALGLC